MKNFEIGQRLCALASLTRGQAAIAREASGIDVLSCPLDEIARQMDELATPLIETTRRAPVAR